MRSSLLIILFLLVAGNAPAQYRMGATRAAVADSVRVMLFALEPIADLEIRSGTLRVDGSARRSPLRVKVKEGSLHVDGTTRQLLVIATGSAAATLQSGARRRRTTGRVTLSVRNNRLVVINDVPMRDYLAGVLVSESDRHDPVEYLAALSALQRNYPAMHQGRHSPDADLCDNTHCQRYSLDGATGAIYSAVDRGAPLRLGSPGALPCYYSVNCGGRTLTPLQVWKNREPGYSTVACTHCRASRWYRWRRSVEATAVARRVFDRAPTAPFVDDDFKIAAGRAIGFNVVLSNTVDRISRRGGHYQVEGRGFGHRVGLCQDGARELARRGRSASDILRFYFPQSTLRRLP